MSNQSRKRRIGIAFEDQEGNIYFLDETWEFAITTIFIIVVLILGVWMS